jgi:hypothetical protein
MVDGRKKENKKEIKKKESGEGKVLQEIIIEGEE